MRRDRARLAAVLTFGFAIAAAACGHELATQPHTAPSWLTPPPPPNFASFDATSTTTSGPISVTFTIQPSSDNTVLIGPHALVIPANSVCDPATSGYGDGTWDNPCSTITAPITVTATASIVNGHPLVEFDTHLRFKPVQDYAPGVVMLYLRDDSASSTAKINWCPTSDTTCVDETQLPSNAYQLQTWYDPSGNWVYRKIKHFSGYNVAEGRDSDSTGGL
ncbi:MAG TPA: hypothetical protein VN706_18670 [Gemmatimonadaceae bacterium]|nr:hypothetical protein [Gemmatimonadaceae bacterium]